MRTLLALALATSVASAQDRPLPVDGSEYFLRVRAVDTTRQAVMKIAFSGKTFGSLGAVGGIYGVVRLGPDGGSGRGTVFGSLMPKRGRMTFESLGTDPELELTVTRTTDATKPVLVARGRVVTVAYGDDGELSVGSKP